ncbi:unnamed protein product [Adineta steineri]|uniref:TauD/TfdA-like domain-containing protein n=1 Tax=Adineta steineri TaxID=433720 RepID=A0A819NRP2_9BILA|nr:unnamed protein product [Adineta steineri]CAF4000809.1 unnamed protein product [Adineta steineri]
MDAIFTEIRLHGQQQQSINGSTQDQTFLPQVLSPTVSSQISFSETLQYIHEYKEPIIKKLVKSGAILFRHFPIQTAEDFNQFALSFNWKELPYIGGAAVRTKVTGCVYTSNDSPPSQPIPFHHEGARVPRYPNYLFFFCEVPPTEGGETPLCYSPLMYDIMKEKCPKFVERLEQQGVRYSRILPNGDDQTSAIGRGWQSTYHTSNMEEAEERCREFETEFEWLDDGCLRTTTKVLPAVKIDERTGKKIWWNTIIGAYYGSLDERNRERSKMVTYGDGNEIELEYLETCKRIFEEIKVQHSRNTFVPPRRILAALFQ